MLGVKSFRSARTTLQGIELMHMIKKGQMISGDDQAPCPPQDNFIHWLPKKPTSADEPRSEKINATEPPIMPSVGRRGSMPVAAFSAKFAAI